MPASRVSNKFKSPPITNLHQWKKVCFLIEHGFDFYTIVVKGRHVRYPATLAGAKSWVKRWSHGAYRYRKKARPKTEVPNG